ncbi:hypothetical protein LTR17_011784 [Elasticomyces elasticus]|nr:hypothetical protein LTR17_011784 [Elasticomyces elasticus]
MRGTVSRSFPESASEEDRTATVTRVTRSNGVVEVIVQCLDEVQARMSPYSASALFSSGNAKPEREGIQVDLAHNSIDACSALTTNRCL